MAQLSITNVTKITQNQYSIDFVKDFPLTDLFYEISLDGITWQTPIALNSLSSPQVITLANTLNFNVRLSSNYTPPTPPETGFLTINSNDKFLINDTDSLKYIN